MPCFAGLGAHDAMYVGGTVPNLKEKTEGKPLVSDEKQFVFKYKQGSLSIPYDKIDSLEYGQKAGRRVGLAIALSPLFLLSHKRRHYLTVGYMDENQKQQAAVLELGKSVIHPTLSTLETRSGKKVEYQDDEARKSAEGK
ncbi:MAG TPA: hypothetical protein VGR50_00495 [Terriglobales bacterium]|nr:hypothetical protein [Terriglobales bacterium]